MLVQIVLLLVGLLLILGGANYLVDGSAAVARRSGTSEFVIGLTIVALGTSMPEMVVSFYSSILGISDMAIGNIVGSNVFNTALILGLTAIIAPITITKSNKSRDIPVLILATCLFVFMGLNETITGLGRNTISRVDGAILLALFVFFMVISFKKDEGYVETKVNRTASKQVRTLYAVVMIVGGFIALILGGRLFVDAARKIAQMMNVSDSFIAITVVAGGTSLPELATCVVAAAKGKGQMALGNVLGSDILNILLIIGGSALIRPLPVMNITSVDFGMLLILAFFFFLVPYVFKRKKIGRGEGIVLVLLEAVYMTWLIWSL